MPDPLTGCKAVFQSYQEAVSKLQRGKAGTHTAEGSTAHRDSHDVGFVHCRDVAPVVVPRVFKGKLRNTLARRLGDELDTLHNSIHDLKERKSCLAERVWQPPGSRPPVCSDNTICARPAQHQLPRRASCIWHVSRVSHVYPSPWATYYKLHCTDEENQAAEMVTHEAEDSNFKQRTSSQACALKHPGICFRWQDKYPQLLTEWKGTVLGKCFHLGIWITAPSAQKAT